MNRPPFSIITCPDSSLLLRYINSLLASHPSVENSGEEWKKMMFWADDGITQSFWENLTLQGLFAIPKALIIRNAQLLNAEALRQLSSGILPLASGGSSLVWPFLCFEVPLDKGKPKLAPHIPKLPIFELAQKNKWLETNPGLTQRDLPDYIRREASNLCIKLQPGQIALLAEALPPDAASIESELAKIALLADESGGLPEDAFALAGQSQELGIFEILRSIQNNRQPQAVWARIMEDRLSGENIVFALSSILMREGRVLWQLLAGESPYLPPQAAAEKKRLAQVLGFPGISKIWDLALKADKGIKTGERSPEQALDVLVAELFTLFQGINGPSRTQAAPSRPF